MSSFALVLAAGQGKRLGVQNKASLKHKGTSFLRCIVQTIRAFDPATTIVVVIGAPFAVENKSLCESLQVQAVVNKHPEEGMASSLALGFGILLNQPEGAWSWLWPVDTPGPSVETLKQIWSHRGQASGVIPSYEGKGGHPALVARALWSSLSRANAEPEGARSVFRRHASSIVRCKSSDPWVLRDCDQRADLALFGQGHEE